MIDRPREINTLRRLIAANPVVRGRLRLGFEVKRTSSPRITPSVRNALHDLKLKTLDVIHAGEQTFHLAAGVRAVAFSRLLEDLKPMRY